jgi:poly(3-hydroxybutyrate) depolymerase
VRNASPHQGPWPVVSIWHGTAGHTVAPLNARELIDQWTEVHGIDQVADGQDTVHGHARQVFKDADGTVLVESYAIAGMGHGTPVAPGTDEEQCGTVGPFVLDAGICSSYHITDFWGLLDGQEPVPPLRRQMLNHIENMQRKLDELKTKVEQVNQ